MLIDDGEEYKLRLSDCVQNGMTELSINSAHKSLGDELGTRKTRSDSVYEPNHWCQLLSTGI